MNIDLKTLQQTLAENKVYDAWPYVLGLIDATHRMSLSFDLAKAVYDHRRNEIESYNQSIHQKAASVPGVQVVLEGLKYPYQNIAGIEVDDTILMEKLAVDFFHYARVSIDIAYQIINTALFGDEAEKEEKVQQNLLCRKLDGVIQFGTLKNIITNASSNNNELKYMREFDNYTKHISNISFSIKNSLFFGNTADFVICAFSYRGIDYPKVDAIVKMDTVMKEVENYIDTILTELNNQVPNATGTSSRYHGVSFKSQIRKHDKQSFIDYVVYFLEVDNGLVDLPSEISILPLAIKPDGEIEDHQLDMDKLFVTIKGQKERGICGIAEVDPNQNKKALYRKYTVKPASVDDFFDYLSTFKEDYKNHKFEFGGMEGTVVMYTMDKEPEEKSQDDTIQSE